MTKIEYLLDCLSEECAEVIQRVQKAKRFGLGEVQPGQPDSNARRIAQEVADVSTILRLLVEHGALPAFSREEAEGLISKKLEKIHNYMHYSRELGILDKE